MRCVGFSGWAIFMEGLATCSSIADPRRRGHWCFAGDRDLKDAMVYGDRRPSPDGAEGGGVTKYQAVWIEGLRGPVREAPQLISALVADHFRIWKLEFRRHSPHHGLTLNRVAPPPAAETLTPYPPHKPPATLARTLHPQPPPPDARHTAITTRRLLPHLTGMTPQNTEHAGTHPKERAAHIAPPPPRDGCSGPPTLKTAPSRGAWQRRYKHNFL